MLGLVVASLAMLSPGAADASQTGGWKIQSTYAPPSGPKENTSLNYVSCSAASACLAIGHAGGKQLTEIWNGAKWSKLLTTNPAGNELRAPSCVSASACTAVGNNNTTDAIVAGRWNGTRPR